MTNNKQTLRERWIAYASNEIADKDELSAEDVYHWWLSELRTTLDSSIKEISGMVKQSDRSDVHFLERYGYNHAIDDILTRLEAQRELIK